MSTLTVADVGGLLETRYPPRTAETWDAVGLVAGDPAVPVRSVLLAVDPVQAVVDEAIARGVDMLITHHPLYLRGTSSVAATTRSEEHTSELQSRGHLVCRLLLEK